MTTHETAERAYPPVLMVLLVIGFVANELVRPVHPRHHDGPSAGTKATVGPESEGAVR